MAIFEITIYRDTGIPEYRDVVIPEYRDTVIPEYRVPNKHQIYKGRDRNGRALYFESPMKDQ
jgi:hypothetical protein